MMDGRDHAGRNDGPGGVNEHLDEVVFNALLDPIGADGLDPAARAVAGAHLVRCAACREALGELEGTVALLRTLPQVAPRRSFVLMPETIEAVGGKVRRDGRAHGPRLAWVWPVRWASALVALLLAITIGLDPGADPTSSSPPAPRTVSQVATATNTVPPATAAPSPTLGSFGAPEGTGEVSIFGLNLTVYPTPTAVPTAAPASPASLGTSAALAWRAAEIALGALAGALAFVGFLMPPLLRRRTAAI